jgi:hypothetical protein
MTQWEEYTGFAINFVEYSDSRAAPLNAVKIAKTSYNNYSTIGDNGSNSTIELNNINATTYIIVLHELGHTIGLFHEHQRPDRNNYITIEFNKIEHGLEDQYTLNQDSEYYNFYQYEDYPFDYNSIVLYSYLILNKAGENVTTGGKHISDIDIQKVRDMYSD